MPSTASPPAYRERLYPSIAWWLLVPAFGAILGSAALFYRGPGWAVVLAVVGAALPGAAIWAWSTSVVVDAAGIRVGRSWAAWAYVGDVEALDRAATQRRLRDEADPAAHLVVRPYLSRAVLVRLDDPADPHPYWLVEVRHPDLLAQRATALLQAARATASAEPARQENAHVD